MKNQMWHVCQRPHERFLPMQVLDAAMGDDWAGIGECLTEALVEEAARALAPQISTLPGRYGRLIMERHNAIAILDAAMGDDWQGIEPTKEQIVQAAKEMVGHTGQLPGRYGRIVRDILFWEERGSA